MKKEAIQSRNRKLSIKSRRRRRARSASTGISMAAGLTKYNSAVDRSPAQMLFNLSPPAAAAVDKRTVTSYLGTGRLPFTPTGSGLSESVAEQRPYYPGRYYISGATDHHEAAVALRHFSPPPAVSHPSPDSIARYAAAATSGCAAMMGHTGHVMPWGASSPYHHFAGPCGSSAGIISAMV